MIVTQLMLNNLDKSRDAIMFELARIKFETVTGKQITSARRSQAAVKHRAMEKRAMKMFKRNAFHQFLQILFSHRAHLPRSTTRSGRKRRPCHLVPPRPYRVKNVRPCLRFRHSGLTAVTAKLAGFARRFPCSKDCPSSVGSPDFVGLRWFFMSASHDQKFKSLKKHCSEPKEQCYPSSRFKYRSPGLHKCSGRKLPWDEKSFINQMLHAC